MNKLLVKFHNDPSLANALKVKAYAQKHPMAQCLLSIAENMIYEAAISRTQTN